MNRRLKLMAAFMALMIILCSVSSATQVSFEKSAVGRIVGDSPDELLEQLNQGDLDFRHATYYTHESNYLTFFGLMEPGRAGQVEQMLDDEFADEKYVLLDSVSWPNEDVLSRWKENELFVMETRYGAMDKANMWPLKEIGYRTPQELGWVDGFGENKPLFLFDSDYGGLYVPKKSEGGKSFVGEYGQDSVMIAPTAVPDREFVKAFVCNLAEYSTYEYVPGEEQNSIGKVYREARNSYYWQSNRPSGLALDLLQINE